MAASGYDGAGALARIAAQLHAEAGAPARLPALWLLTDPQRLADPARAAAALPRGSGVIHRHFGAATARREAETLAEAARANGLVLLIAGDPKLAEAVGAAGVHWPARRIHKAAAWRRDNPDGLTTAAAHSPGELAAAAEAGVDAAFLSPVFATRSASARAPLGVEGFTTLAAGVQMPVIALGGVTAETAESLIGSGAAGIGAVDALAGSG